MNQAKMFEEASRHWQSLFETGVAQWQQQLAQGMKSFGNQAPSWASGVRMQMENAQKVWLSAMQTFAGQTSEFWKNVKSPADFAATFPQFRSDLHKKFTDAVADSYKQFGDYNQLWDEFLGHYKSFQNVGSDFFAPYKSATEGFSAPKNPEEWMQSGLQFMHQLFDQAGGKTFDAPALGMMRNYTHLVNQAFKAFREEKEAERVFQTLVAKTWASVVAEMTKTVWERGQEGKPITSLRELSRVWAGVTDEVFMEVFKSEAYVQTQLNYLNASFRYRKAKRALTEVVLDANDLPTLTQVDDLIERVYSLNKAVRAEARSRKSAEKEVATLHQTVAEQSEALAKIQEQLALLLDSQNGQTSIATTQKRATRKTKTDLA